MTTRLGNCGVCNEDVQIYTLGCESCLWSFDICHECRTAQEFSYWNSSLYCSECRDKRSDCSPMDRNRDDVPLHEVPISAIMQTLPRPELRAVAGLAPNRLAPSAGAPPGDAVRPDSG